MAYLYRYEAKRIQSWILATDVLRELRGGSECVEQLGQLAERLAEPDGEPLISAAGVGMFRFPTRQGLERFRTLWPLIASRHAPGLPIAQAWIEEREGIETLFALLKAAPRLTLDTLPHAGPLTLRAARTGLPAITRVDDTWIDAATAAKLERARLERGRFAERVGGDLELLDDMHEWHCQGIGVIHADGNGLGARFSRYSRPEQLAEASRRLSDATTAALRGALRSLSKQVGSKRIPARVVVAGGDDVTIIVAAEHAIPLAVDYLHRFEAETSRVFDDGHSVTAAAGIALVKLRFPFHRAYELAEELCTEAKRRFGTGQKPAPSALAFHRVTTSRLEPYDDIVERTLTTATGRRTLTRRAYGLAELSALDRLMAALDGLPRGPFREWLRLARGEERHADYAWNRIEEVCSSRSGEAWRALLAALGELGCANGPWSEAREAGGAVSTPLGDALAWRAVCPRRGSGKKSRLWEREG